MPIDVCCSSNGRNSTFQSSRTHFNANGIKEVPVYVAIDEYGVVRGLPRQPVGFAADFIEQDFAEPESPADIVDSHSVSTEY